MAEEFESAFGRQKLDEMLLEAIPDHDFRPGRLHRLLLDLPWVDVHHILPHLSWTIDYLVAEATLLSGGQVSFPSQRQHGYVWFDSRVYGHASGKVFGTEGAWLWFRRGVVKLDNPAINYLLARTGNRLCVILMNESQADERLAVDFLLDQEATAKLTAEPLVPMEFASRHTYYWPAQARGADARRREPTVSRVCCR